MGVYSPNPHFGAWIGIQSLTRKILKLAYYRNYYTEPNKIFHCDKGHQILFLCGRNAYNKSKMGDGRNFKKSRKIVMSPQWLDRSSWNLAQWRVLTTQTVPAVKISNFQEFEMENGRHLEKSQKWLSRKQFERSARNLASVLFCSLAVLDPRVGHTMDLFSMYLCPLSFWLTLPRGVLSMYWCCPSRPCVVFLACVHLTLYRYLALSLSPGNSLVSSWCDHSILPSLRWQCLTVPSLLQLC